MTYLVERLRAVDCSWSDVGELGAGAADEIERLRAENAELVEAMCHPTYAEENRLRAELAALKSHTVDCIGLALELEDRARTVESQTTERAMIAAANALRLLAAPKPGDEK